MIVRTTDVFEAEERFQDHGIAVEIVPTPVQDKAYYGVCIYIPYLSRARLGIRTNQFISCRDHRHLPRLRKITMHFNTFTLKIKSNITIMQRII